MTFQRIYSNTKDIVVNFVGGELAKSHWGNILTNFYSVSAKEINNLLPMPTGGLKKRPGTFLLERGPTPFITYPWSNNDIIIRESAGGGVEYKIYSNNIEQRDWTQLNGENFADAHLWQILLSEPTRIVIGTKNGVLSADDKLFKLEQKIIIQPVIPNTPGYQLTDFTNAVLFSNTLVTFQDSYIFYSESGNPYVFDSPNADFLSKAGYVKLSFLQDLGTSIIQALAVDNFILVATNHGIHAVFRNSIDKVIYFYSSYVTDLIAVDGGLLFMHGYAFIGTNGGLYAIDASAIGQTNVTTGATGVIQNNNVRATNFRVDNIAVYAEHVFLTDVRKMIKKYTRHRVIGQEVIYALRDDGIIISFTMIPRVVSGGNTQPVVARRTCNGKYVWIATDFMNTVVSLRAVPGDSQDYFVEKTIFRNNNDDNKITNRIYDFEDTENYLFWDCGAVTDGVLGYIGEKLPVTTNNQIRIEKNTGIVVNDQILINGLSFHKVLSVDTTNKFYDYIVVDETRHSVPNGEVKIDAKIVGDFATKYTEMVKDLPNIQYFSYNTSENGHVRDWHRKPASTYLGTCGFGYPAYVRMLHTTVTARIERLVVGMTVAETEFVQITVYNHGDSNEIRDNLNFTSLQTEYKTLDIASISAYQNLKPEIKISAVEGDNLVILNMAYIITPYNIQN